MKPRCFKNQNVASLPLSYHANKKAWMTAPLFQMWLLKLQRQMALRKQRILLLLDNCTAHTNLTLDLPNIELLFFSPNCTSLLQPLDQGIIQNMKVHYKKRLVTAYQVQVDAGKQKDELK